MGVSVVVTPQGQAALGAVTTAANGGFSRSGVPTIPANGAITLSGLPNGCINAGPYTYSGHTTAGTTRNIVVDCPPAPVTYPLTGAWTYNSATRVASLTISIDMGSAPGNPLVNGTNADSLAGITLGFGYSTAQITTVGRSNQQADFFDISVLGTPTPGNSTLASASSGGLLLGGSFALVRMNFTLAAGVASGASVNVATTVSQALVGLGGATNATSSFTVNVPAFIVP
jgi:hypothetical protein